MSSAHRWQERRELRRNERRRRRGGDGRPPVFVQRTTAAIGDGWRSTRHRVTRAVRGDRPLIIAVVAVLIVGAVVLAGPAQSYLDGRARVDNLATTAAALDEANAGLEQRVDDLNDPENIELIAREQQSFIRPGEVPYAVVPPEVDRPRITAPRDGETVEADRWYERAWSSVTSWFR